MERLENGRLTGINIIILDLSTSIVCASSTEKLSVGAETAARTSEAGTVSIRQQVSYHFEGRKTYPSTMTPLLLPMQLLMFTVDSVSPPPLLIHRAERNGMLKLVIVQLSL